MIFTSYFARIKDLPPDIVPIGICAGRPKFYNGLMYTKVAPLQSFLWKYKYEDHDTEQYTKCFYEQVLSQLNQNQVLEELYKLSGGKDIALICYEKPSDFCHRHLVADWLTENTGEEVKEFDFH